MVKEGLIMNDRYLLDKIIKKYEDYILE